MVLLADLVGQRVQVVTLFYAIVAVQEFIFERAIFRCQEKTNVGRWLRSMARFLPWTSYTTTLDFEIRYLD
jgi:hypothetical protein